MAKETVDTNDQAYEFFVQESQALLQHLETGLMSLCQDHETPTIHGLMRAAHSIKGGAACVGLMAIQAIAHDLENGIRALYKEDTVFDVELENLLLKAYDALQDPINQQIHQGEYDPDQALGRAKPIFSQLEQKLGHALDEAAELPEMQMEGDITEFIFKEEVPQALGRLENYVKKPPTKNPHGELVSQMEVLATLGDMLNLEGFAAIAQVAQAALETNTEQYLEIARCALADFQAGQAAVLEGDRTQGGEPSAALRQLSQIQTAPPSQEPEIPPQETVSDSVSGDNGEDLGNGLSLDADELAALQFLTQNARPEAEIRPVLSDTDLAELILEADDVLAEVDVDLTSLVLMDEPEPSEPITQNDDVVSTEDKTSPSTPQATVLEPSLRPNADVAPVPEKTPVTEKAIAPPPNPVLPTIDTNNLSVRLDMGRLNHLNNLVGELVTQDNSALLRNKQSSDALNSLKRWYGRLDKITTQLQEYAKELVAKNPQARTQLAQFVIFASTMAEEMAQLSETIEDTTLIAQQDQQALKQRQQTLKQLENNLIQARMLPIGELLNRFPRTVRDLSVKDNKPVTLNLEGTDTLVDRAILSKLYDPLVHLVRNAFDHGIDSPEERAAHNKSEAGTITIKAYNRGNSTYLEIQDDGRGIDIEKVRTKAVRKGLVSATEATELSRSQLYELLFVPGFSTAEQVSHLSGRGVGLDAVRLQIRALKGNITLTSELGQGTTFTLRLPWSMTITKLLIFRCQESFFAVPINSLSAIAAAKKADFTQDGHQEQFHWQGKTVPLVQTLLSGFNYPAAAIASRQQIGSLAQGNISNIWNQVGQQMVLVMAQANEVIGLRVDQILLEQDLVIKPFGTAIASPQYISGCTILGDGRLVPVLDSAALIERVCQKDNQNTAIIDPQFRARQPKLTLPTVLAIDDSLTTRQTLSTTLQKAGYRVIQAQDGADGLNQLELHPEVVGIICDVEMPNMNGFEFLGRCRKKHPKTELPVLMLTSRGSKRYRQLAQQLGASGYLTKPYLDQELVETLQGAIAETKAKPTAIATV
ncbi:hybrid sensor histidine kinase/response regulator [Picosynechococcus sp. PCC 7003]|uniref:hybrid sensor histidine kinase/response regulator n=1 Tax=Picosynechococcus sp. PCC 7003 TaxID=374981 RepID=UPI000810D7FA|nr:hybrid sensor histidine kinase/response regulator [Picosynechococcus sp. PCC 7003]ANV82960.1 hybrid sensor histidine kinase/response regulator [Picosynechococcus sp. PCC 7003]